MSFPSPVNAVMLVAFSLCAVGTSACASDAAEETAVESETEELRAAAKNALVAGTYRQQFDENMASRRPGAEPNLPRCVSDTYLRDGAASGFSYTFKADGSFSKTLFRCDEEGKQCKELSGREARAGYHGRYGELGIGISGTFSVHTEERYPGVCSVKDKLFNRCPNRISVRMNGRTPDGQEFKETIADLGDFFSNRKNGLDNPTASFFTEFRYPDADPFYLANGETQRLISRASTPTLQAEASFDPCPGQPYLSRR